MKKLSIALALILCVALCVFCFASCGKKKADATTAAPGTTPTTTESSTTAPATTAEATTAEVTTAATTAEPCQHVPADDYTVDVPATCGEAGSKSYHCTICGESIPGTEVRIDPDSTAHEVASWTVTKEATLFEQTGSRHGECSVCHQDVVEDTAFVPAIYNPADLSNYEGDKSMLLLTKTLPQIAGDDHFYPTEQNPAGKAVFFEFALLYNETMANSATDEFDLCLNYQGAGGKTLYVFVTKDNGSGWCKYAGGFDYANKKAILYGPEGGNAQPKENYPNMGNYGWHMIGVKFYETAALDGDNVVYSGVSTLYVDGVKVWELDVDMSKFVLSGNKTLRLFDATNNAGVLTYADNENAAKVRMQLRGEGINNSAAPMYFVYTGEKWSIVDADYAPSVRPVASPAAATYKLSDTLTVPAAIYFEEPTLPEPDLDFDVAVYNPADLSNFEGDKSMLLLSKTLPEIAGDDHFYPTEQNPDGKDAYFEFAVLWNETLANCANQYFQLCMNYKGGSGSILFYFIPKDNAPDTWCKFAGGFDWGRGKGDDPILFGPSGVEHGQKTDYPNIGEYGWHKIGFRFHQSAALSGENVVYSGVSSLYIDGVLVWQVDLNMDRIKSDKNLLFTATNNAGVLAYADNENAAKVRMQIRGEGINNSTDPTYFVFGGATWAIVDADWTPNVEPVADPTPAEYRLSDTLTVPASVYFQAKSN